MSTKPKSSSTSSSSSSALSAKSLSSIVLATGIAAAATKYADSKYFFVKDTRLLAGFGAFAVRMKYNELTNWTVADGLEDAARKWPGKDAIVFDQQVYTFAQWNAKANQVGRWGKEHNICKGRVVAVMLENKPEALFAWTGLSKVGGVGALINYNLRAKPLFHCIKVCLAGHLLFGIECYDQVLSIASELLEANIKLHCQGGRLSPEEEVKLLQPIVYVDEIWAKNSVAPIPKAERADRTYNDAASYIFTSGTTGLPKAAIVKHAKLDGAGAAFSLQFGIKHEDRIYNSGLPLYHSAANNIGGGVCLYTGATLILRRKFSASNFWREVGEFDCTVIQYIGELARYLLATPPSVYDKRHKCRLAVGNGLRPDIWESFQTRFALKEIGEFYGATEGNVALFNLAKTDRARGAIGHMGPVFRTLTGLCTLLKYDPETGEIVRDPKTGFCIETKPGEAGEGVSELKGRAAGSFDGYLGDKEQSEKKILRNVFRKGDAYFRTGDLLMADELGYYYFIDRMGDSFRWKGENVATSQVQEVVSQSKGVLEVTVYGVQIPGKDGRAGCAAIVQKENEELDLADFYRVANASLPTYAVPIFVRVLPKIQTTGTFKHQKNELREEGMNIAKIKDAMFILDTDKKTYVPFGPTEYDNIITGKSRL